MKVRKQLASLRRAIAAYERTIAHLRAYIVELERWHAALDAPDGWDHRGVDSAGEIELRMVGQAVGTRRAA